MQEWNEQKLPNVLPGYSGGRLPGRSTKVKGRKDGKVDEDSGEIRIRRQIAQKVVVGINENASVHKGVKEAVRRPAGQSFVRSWDWRKKWKWKSWTSTRSKIARGRPLEVEVGPWNGRGCAETRNTE